MPAASARLVTFEGPCCINQVRPVQARGSVWEGHEPRVAEFGLVRQGTIREPKLTCRDRQATLISVEVRPERGAVKLGATDERQSRQREKNRGMCSGDKGGFLKLFVALYKCKNDTNSSCPSHFRESGSHLIFQLQ